MFMSDHKRLHCHWGSKYLKARRVMSYQMRGSGATLSGEKANDMHPDEPGGGLRLMRPKSVVSVDLNGRFFHKRS